MTEDTYFDPCALAVNRPRDPAHCGGANGCVCECGVDDSPRYLAVYGAVVAARCAHIWRDGGRKPDASMMKAIVKHAHEIARQSEEGQP